MVCITSLTATKEEWGGRRGEGGGGGGSRAPQDPPGYAPVLRLLEPVVGTFSARGAEQQCSHVTIITR